MVRSYRDHKELTAGNHPGCNNKWAISPPTGGRPALLSMDDVLTLFHEFGHGLQVLFSRTPTHSTTRGMDIVDCHRR